MFGLFDMFFVYTIFAPLLGGFNMTAPLGGLNLLFITFGIAICNMGIALQVSNNQKTNQ